MDGEDIDAKPQVFTKLLWLDHVVQVSVCGGNDTDIHVYGFRSPPVQSFFPEARVAS